MRSIHISNHQSASNNKSSGAILFKHRTKPKNSSGRFIILSIIPLLPLFLLSILLNLSTSLGGDAYATTTTLTVDNSDTVLELTLPSSVTLDLAPSSNNDYISFGTVDLGIGAGTNNPLGYTLSMTSTNPSIARTASITDGDSNTIAPTIEPMLTTGSSTGYTAEQFASNSTNAYTLNRWGYKLSTNTNYMPMTTDTIELASTSQASNATFVTNPSTNTIIGTDLTLNFAAKVDGNMPAGTYRTTISFTLVAKVPRPDPVTYTASDFMAIYNAVATNETLNLSSDVIITCSGGNLNFNRSDLLIDGNGYIVTFSEGCNVNVGAGRYQNLTLSSAQGVNTSINSGEFRNSTISFGQFAVVYGGTYNNVIFTTSSTEIPPQWSSTSIWYTLSPVPTNSTNFYGGTFDSITFNAKVGANCYGGDMDRNYVSEYANLITDSGYEVSEYQTNAGVTRYKIGAIENPKEVDEEPIPWWQ